MTNVADRLDTMLKRRGVSDFNAYLNDLDDGAELCKSKDPEVKVRGSVFLIMRAIISRADVKKGLSKLKHV